MKKFLFISSFFILAQRIFAQDIVIDAFDWGYKPDKVILKKGEPVKLTLTSSDGKHGLGSKELGFNLKASPEKPETIEFTPDKVGTFEGDCTVSCGRGHRDMKVTFEVQE